MLNLRRKMAKRRQERGAVLVELTLVVPILVTLVLGMFEVGMAWGATQTVVQSARSGARTVSQLGDYAYSDQEGLRAVLSTFGDDVDRVERVTFYEYDASEPDGVPFGCRTSSQAGFCNTYGTSDFLLVTNDAHFADSEASCGGEASAPWCPISQRDNSQLNATLIGVEVEFRHARVSGFFGVGDMTLTQRTVMKIEPETTS